MDFKITSKFKPTGDQPEAIKQLVDGSKSAGFYTAHWDGRDKSGQPVISGMYFYRIAAHSEEGEEQSFVDIKKMILIK